MKVVRFFVRRVIFLVAHHYCVHERCVGGISQKETMCIADIALGGSSYHQVVCHSCCVDYTPLPTSNINQPRCRETPPSKEVIPSPQRLVRRVVVHRDCGNTLQVVGDSSLSKPARSLSRSILGVAHVN